MKRSAFVILLILAITSAEGMAQGLTAAETSSAGALIVLGAQSGYALLPQAGALTSWGLELGADWGISARVSGLYLAPSAWAAEGYRYRGFMAGLAGAGAYLYLGTLRFNLGVSGALARYQLSDSWFFFPTLDASLQWDMLALDDGALGLALDGRLLLRADAGGLAVGASLFYRRSKPEGRP